MIDSLEIENFRCFEKISVGGLGLVNVVVGESAAGKTALLEAISLGMGGGPDLPFKFRVWRGLGSSATLTMSRKSYESIWQDLFYQMDQKLTVHIILHGTAETKRIFEMAYRPQTVAASVPSGDSSVAATGPLDSSLITPITLEWILAGGDKHTLQPVLTPLGFAPGGIGFPALAAFFSSAFMAITGPSEAASQFSEFSKKKKDAPLRKALKAVFPRVSDLSVESDPGGNALYCSVPWMSEKVPVALVSSGINKLLVILLGIATMTKGVILVDELENGIYYKTYPDIWKSLLHFCRKFKCQLFVSTHSMECLRAALPALQGNEDKFRLLRVERKNGNRIVRIFKGKDFEAAMEAETEVR
jgi:hypothetical protein